MIEKQNKSIDQRIIFREFPRLAELVKPLNLLDLPSPITEEKELAALWSLKSLHIKRDDLVSEMYGGSKTRMLEYFFGRARMQNRNIVASMGPFISHQLLGIGAYAKVLGYQCFGVLAPQPPNKEIEHYQKLYEEADIKTIRCQRYYQIPFAYFKTRFSGFRKNRRFWIPPGGNDAYGVVAMVEAAFEFAKQIEDGEIEMPQDVVVATGTCATAAGLYLGFSMLNLPVRVVAVRVVPMAWTSSDKLLRTAKKGLKVLRQAGFKKEVNWAELLWVNNHARPGYGLTNTEAELAMDDVKQHGSFRTEITYTGKTLGIFKEKTLEDRKVVFWNTFSAIEPNYDAIKSDYEQ